MDISDLTLSLFKYLQSTYHGTPRLVHLVKIRGAFPSLAIPAHWVSQCFVEQKMKATYRKEFD